MYRHPLSVFLADTKGDFSGLAVAGEPSEKIARRTESIDQWWQPAYDLEELLTQLGTGEAVVTVLSETGAPSPVPWTRVRTPQSPARNAARGAMRAAGTRPPVTATAQRTGIVAASWTAPRSAR